MIQLSGIRYKGRTVRCNDADKQEMSNARISSSERKHHRPKVNDADEGGKNPAELSKGYKKSNRKKNADSIDKPKRQKKDDWRSLMNKVPRDLRGPEPDFTEEGWAMRKPRKKKK